MDDKGACVVFYNRDFGTKPVQYDADQRVFETDCDSLLLACKHAEQFFRVIRRIEFRIVRKGNAQVGIKGRVNTTEQNMEKAPGLNPAPFAEWKARIAA